MLLTANIAGAKNEVPGSMLGRTNLLKLVLVYIILGSAAELAIGKDALFNCILD